MLERQIPVAANGSVILSEAQYYLKGLTINGLSNSLFEIVS